MYLHRYPCTQSIQILVSALTLLKDEQTKLGRTAVMPFKMHNNRSLVVHLCSGGLAFTKELYLPYKHIVSNVYLSLQ